MISLEKEHSLSSAAFWYTTLPAIVIAIIVFLIGAFVKDLALSSCVQSACPPYLSAIMLTVVIAFILAILAQPVLSYMLFSYQVSTQSITINSGIFFRQYETIDFNRIQTLDLERGPLLWLFGLTEVRLWTASADQFNIEMSEHSVESHAQPDTILILPRDTAIELRDFIAQAKHATGGPAHE